jgi:hypothetical protein
VSDPPVPLVFASLHVPPLTPTSLTASFTAVRWDSLSAKSHVRTFVSDPETDQPLDLPSSTITTPDAISGEGA